MENISKNDLHLSAISFFLASRAQCAALETSLASLRSSAPCLLDVVPAAGTDHAGKHSKQEESLHGNSVENSALKSVDRLRACVPTLHNRVWKMSCVFFPNPSCCSRRRLLILFLLILHANSQIHDFNYRWRTRWAQWALPPNEAGSSKTKAKSTRSAAAYRVDDDEYDNESFEDENQQPLDNQDDEDETSTGARFNAHRIGATMQRMHMQLAPIQVRLVFCS